MATESMSDRYEKGLQLAEAGRHEEALECIQAHLADRPNDEQGYNDAGAILFCLGRIDEAIKYFEKALRLCGEHVSGEILWNLCQAYLDGGYSSEAAGLFDAMNSQEILNADIINRTANEFLKQESYGNAIEMLLDSLEMTPEQDVLEPMLDVIRSKRAKVAVYCGHDNPRVGRISDYLSKRFVSELHIADSIENMRFVMDSADILWIEGVDETAAALLQMPKSCRIVINLSAEDLSSRHLPNINWSNVDTAVLTGSSYTRELLVDIIPGIETSTRLIMLNYGVDVKRCRFVDRARGRNLAYIGDLDSEHNAMFLLQCMQKLNYIDPDYRLYIAAESTDTPTQQYLRYMIDRLNLSGVVFFDRNVTNVEKWLRDKHYVISTGTGCCDLSNVFTAMACGVKPVLHNFPGADEMIASEFVFDIAEQFCEQILSKTYQPRRYRSIVESSQSKKTWNRRLNDILFRLEKDPFRSAQARWNTPVATGRFGSDNSQLSFAQPPSDIIEPISVSVPKTIPITPAQTSDFDIRANTTEFGATSPLSADTNWGTAPVIDPASTQKDYFQMGAEGTIERLAREALEASQNLAEMAQRDHQAAQPTHISPIPSIEGSFSGDIQLPQGGFSSLDALTRDRQISKVASEFTDGAGPITSEDLNIAGTHQIPFTG